MKINYFEATDTALLEFSRQPVDETREINENICIDLDSTGNLVSMTIEHATIRANMAELAFQRIAGG